MLYQLVTPGANRKREYWRERLLPGTPLAEVEAVEEERKAMREFSRKNFGLPADISWYPNEDGTHDGLPTAFPKTRGADVRGLMGSVLADCPCGDPRGY
jgi:hypothetical protein